MVQKGSPARNSCATCHLNSVLWERCLAMGFILRKPGQPGQILNPDLSTPRRALQIGGQLSTPIDRLTGFVAGPAREVSLHNVTINNLFPGSFETDRLYEIARAVAEPEGRTAGAQLEIRRRGEVSGRFDWPEKLGPACAFLCSASAGYVTGQNVLLDGSLYPGTF